MFAFVRTLGVCFSLSCFFLGSTALAQASDKPLKISIPAGNLADSLEKLGEQSGLQIMYEPAVAKDIKVAAVSGTLTVSDALTQLLAQTGLQADRVNDKTVVLKRAEAEPVKKEQDQPSTANSPAQEHSEALEEIIVTAQKRKERLQDVPISITALSSDTIDRAAITRVNDIEKLVPNFSFESTYGAAQDSRLTMRGITGNVRNAGFESGLSVYVDGVYAGRPASQNLNLLNIERIEVLRGPQGTLFGKNTIVGVVNIVTRKPGEDFEGKFGLNLGNFNKRNVNGYISGPITDDKLFFGASFFSNDRDGYVKNFFDGGKLGSEGVNGGDLKLRYLASPNLEMNLRVDYLKDDYLFPYPEPLDGTSTIGDGIVYSPGIRTVNFDGIPRERREAHGVSLSMDYRWGNHMFTSITAFNRSEYSHSEDNDDSPLDSLLVLGWREVASYASQEFRLASPTDGRFDYLLGAYLFWQNARSDVPFRTGFGFDPPGLATAFADIDTESAAFFSHANYHLTDKVTLTAGLRFTVDRKEVKDFHMTAVGTFADIFNFPRFTDEREDSDWSPMISLGYAVNENMNVYAKAARGFKSGGWNTDFIAREDGTPPPASSLDFDPEFATTYELGFKSTLLGRRLTLNVAAFQTDYEDLQVESRVFDPSSNLFLFEFNNAATSTIKGLEVEALAYLFDGLSLRAGAGYTDAVYDSFKGAAFDADGNPVDFDGFRLPHAPDWNGSLMITYERPLAGNKSLLVSLDYSYKDEFFTNAANDPDLKMDSRSLLGGRIGIISSDKLEVFLWGENLADKDYLITKQKGTGDVLRGTWGMPRSYGVQLGYSF